MTLPTAAQYMQLIVNEVGDTASNDIALNIAGIWALYEYADYVQYAPNFRYLLAKEHALNFLIGKLRDTAIDKRLGAQSANNHQKIQTLSEMRDQVAKQINDVKRLATAVRTPAIDVLSTTAPITPASDPRTVGSFDPNARDLKGDPLLPTITIKQQ